MGQATPSAIYLSCMLISQASCVIVSGFIAVLDLDTYPLSNLIRLRCTKQAKPGRGKPVLIMHIGLFACFSRHISRTQSFQQNRHIHFLALVALKLLVSLISRLVDRQTDKQIHRPSTVNLAAHARRGLINTRRSFPREWVGRLGTRLT